jgi:hypothetical protein
MTPICLDHETLAQTIAESNLLDRYEHAGLTIHVAEREGRDILIMESPATGGGVVIEPDSADAEHGGSIHDHARGSNDVGAH